MSGPGADDGGVDSVVGSAARRLADASSVDAASTAPSGLGGSVGHAAGRAGGTPESGVGLGAEIGALADPEDLDDPAAGPVLASTVVDGPTSTDPRSPDASSTTADDGAADAAEAAARAAIAGGAGLAGDAGSEAAAGSLRDLVGDTVRELAFGAGAAGADLFGATFTGETSTGVDPDLDGGALGASLGDLVGERADDGPLVEVVAAADPFDDPGAALGSSVGDDLDEGDPEPPDEPVGIDDPPGGIDDPEAFDG